MCENFKTTYNKKNICNNILKKSIINSPLNIKGGKDDN